MAGAVSSAVQRNPQPNPLRSHTFRGDSSRFARLARRLTSFFSLHLNTAFLIVSAATGSPPGLCTLRTTPATFGSSLYAYNLSAISSAVLVSMPSSTRTTAILGHVKAVTRERGRERVALCRVERSGNMPSKTS